VLQRVRVPVVADAVAKPHTQGSVRHRVARLLDLAVAVERLKEPVAQLLELRIGLHESHLNLAVRGDGVTVALRVGGHLDVGLCGRRSRCAVALVVGVAVVDPRGALAAAGCCAGALLADIGQRGLDPNERRVQQPGERDDDVAASSPGDTGEQHVSTRVKVAVGPPQEVVQA
jgi:hypothetical protein